MDIRSALNTKDMMQTSAIPPSVGRAFQVDWVSVTSLRVVRGIRLPSQHLYGTRPESTRALNARSITSKIVSDINRTFQIPYCIWSRDLASEDAYREVARRYPQMAYQVGRA